MTMPQGTAPSRFIFGEGLMGSEEHRTQDYLVHTQHPRFVCVMEEVDQEIIETAGQKPEVIQRLDDLPVYFSHYGYRLSNFFFWDNQNVSDEELTAICIQALETYMSLWRNEDQGNTAGSHELYIVQPQTLRTEHQTELFNQVLDLSRSSQQAEPAAALVEAVRQLLLCDNASLFVDLQWTLRTQPDAYQALVNAAHQAIAEAVVPHDDGEADQYTLWGLPVIIARDHSGMWWHFPELAGLEKVFKDILGVECRVSTTLFTFRMLQDTDCQPLIHLDRMFHAKQDVAIYDPVESRAAFYRLDQQEYPHISLCWIPVWFRHDPTLLETVERHTRLLMETALPVLQRALSGMMNYAEVELFTPQPWWQSIRTIVDAINRRRFLMFIKSIRNRDVDTNDLMAFLTYHPDDICYNISLELNGERLADMDWWLVPDMTFDKAHSLEVIHEVLDEVGIPVVEQNNLAIQ